MDWQIIASVGSLLSGLGVLVAVLVYLLNRKSFSVNIDFKRKENATNIAEKYAKSLQNVSFLISLYSEFGKATKFVGFNTGAIRKFATEQKDKPLSFNKEEYDKVFNKKDILAEMEKHLKEGVVLFLDTYMMHYDVVELKGLIAEIEKRKAVAEEDFFELNRVLNKYKDLKADTLNELEVMCMSFNCKIADENIVFRSLHQTLLAFIRLMYPDIASQNTDPTKKYYTHIIELYNRWNKKYNKNRLRIENKKREIAELKENQEKSIARMEESVEKKINKSSQIKT